MGYLDHGNGISRTKVGLLVQKLTVCEKLRSLTHSRASLAYEISQSETFIVRNVPASHWLKPLGRSTAWL